MLDSRVIKKGISALISGDLESIKDYVNLKFGHKISPHLPGVTHILIDDTSEIPNWIRSSASATVAVIEDYHYSECFVSFDEDVTETEITVEVPEDSELLLVNIIGIKNIEEIELEFEIFKDSGSTETRQQTYNGDIIARARGSRPRSVLPVELELDSEATEIKLECNSVEYNRERFDTKEQSLMRLSNYKNLRYGKRAVWSSSRKARFSMPAVQSNSSNTPPIFLITIDTLRFDSLNKLDKLLEALGEHAVVPQQPRTQGYWTRPSLASILTGVHPTTHKYHLPEHIDGIDSSLTTLPEFLSQQSYNCRFIDTKGGLNRGGFARGFQVCYDAKMGWNRREHDASFVANKLTNWIDVDTRRNARNGFYFAHIFDPHYPYLPPDGYREGIQTEVKKLEPYLKRQGNRGDTDYLREMQSLRDEVDPKLVDDVITMYEGSVEFVANQLIEVVNAIKRSGMFEDSLIIVAGDHGEEFQDHGFIGHSSLFNTVIKPGMIVKPPAGTSMSVPDDVDFIDIYPTIASMIGADPPQQCVGTAFQDLCDKTVRITEGYVPEYYTVAAESDGIKRISVFQNDSQPPSPSTHLDNGPTETFFFSVGQGVQENRIAPENVNTILKRKLKQATSQFIDGLSDNPEHGHTSDTYLTEDVDERLQELGYK